MLKKVLFILVLMITFSKVFSQNSFITGKIVDFKNQPIKDVYVCRSDNSRCTFTNRNGNFNLYTTLSGEISIYENENQYDENQIPIKKVILVKNNQIIKIFPKKITAIKNIISDDFLKKIKKDTTQIAIPVGNYKMQNFNSSPILIEKDSENNFKFKSKNDYANLNLEYFTELTYSKPIRLYSYQNRFSQGKNEVFQSNEILSWGKDISNEKTFNSNDFLRNTFDFTNSINAQIQTPNEDIFKLSLLHKTTNGIIPENKITQFNGSLKYTKTINSHEIKVEISHNQTFDNLTNENFLINKILFANAITPINFDNSGEILNNGKQNSFSTSANNPYFLIKNNEDFNKEYSTSLLLNYKFKKLNSNLIFQDFNSKINQGIMPNFNENIASNYSKRNENFQNFQWENKYNFSRYIETKLNGNYQKRDFKRDYFSDFSTLNQFPNDGNLVNRIQKIQDRFTAFLNGNGNYTFNNLFNNYEELTLNQFIGLNYSSILKDNFVGNFSTTIELKRLFNSKISFYTKYALIQNEPSLQNNNLSFNSLNYSILDFNSIQNSQELFTLNQTTPIQNNEFSFGTEYTFALKINANYYQKNVLNAYASILKNGNFNWLPAFDYEQKGVEITIENYRLFRDYDLKYNFDVNFNWFKNEVTKLKNNENSIAYAGFSDMNKSYIKGESLGILVGSSFLRDENNAIINDSNGNPIKNNEPKIIGDTNPDFVVNFNNSIEYKRFSLSVNFDWSQGGDLWNGTQNTLNYFGKSDLTQNRTINDQNKWLNYGKEGISEQAIEDATYFRLNSLSISYRNHHRNTIDFKISLFMNNVFMIAKSKTAFANQSLFNGSETVGLNYFNAPFSQSFGISLNVKL